EGGVVPSPAGGGGDHQNGTSVRAEGDGAAVGSDGKDFPPGGDDDSSRPKRRRGQQWLRAVFATIIILELLAMLAVYRFGTVYQAEVNPVTFTAEDGTTTVVGDNPELLYPITLGGDTCRASDMITCIAADASAETLATACCSELLDPDSPGPEEFVTTIATFGYTVFIPGLILVVRGFLLGRLWTVKFMRHRPFCTRGRDEAAWGKRRWHLRVGFYALDAVLGLIAAESTALLFSSVAKVTIGRPRPNYYALVFYTEHTANGKDYTHWSHTSWPSGHAVIAMAGLHFLAYVLWSDLSALVMWRRRAHPRLSVVLAFLGSFLLLALPMSALLIGVSRIREYWHYPDDVVVGLIIGSAGAHWAFQIVVLMPFRHEIGSPDWKKDPKW
ncbi:unnamed protein product, partial [Scytosiphon promiscuus]